MSEFQHSAEFDSNANLESSPRKTWFDYLTGRLSPARPFCFLALLGLCITGANLFNRYLADRFDVFGPPSRQVAENVDPNFFEVVPRPGQTSVLARRLDGAILEVDLKGDQAYCRMFRKPEGMCPETALFDGNGHLPLCIELGYSKDYVLQADNIDSLRVLQLPRDHSLMSAAVVNGGNAAFCCVSDESYFPEGKFACHLIDLDNGQCLKSLPLDEFVFSVVQHPADGSVYIASRGGVFVWKQGADELELILDTPTRALQAVENSSRLLIGSFQGTLISYNPKIDQIEWACDLARSSAIKSIVMSPINPDECLVAGEFEQLIRVDLNRGFPKSSIDHDAALVNGVAFSSDGQHLFVAQSNARLTIWQVDRRIPILLSQL